MKGQISGTSPFLEVQARDVPPQRLASGFYPTAAFWNLFTTGHQVVLGTRGSGKTSLIRMLSYGCLRQLNHPRSKLFVKKRQFVGFYVPLHLEQMTLISQNDENYSDRVGYFKFLFNHIAAVGFIDTIQALLHDCFRDSEERLRREVSIAEILIAYWYPAKAKIRPTLSALRAELGIWAYRIDRWRDSQGTPEELPPLCKACLEPIVAVLPRVNEILEISEETTTWIACIDEAEFLQPPFLKAVNTFMRSKNRGLVVRLATSPFRYSPETEVQNSPLEPSGSDFRYLLVDLPVDGKEFMGLCDHLCRTRSKAFGGKEYPSLAALLGSSDDCPDTVMHKRFSEIVGEANATHEAIDEGIMSVISSRRIENTKRRELSGLSNLRPFHNKFAPVYYMRRLRELNRQGNANVGWFSGPRMFRLVSEGNPRRFLDLMHLLYEESRTKPRIDQRLQQDVILKFSKTILADSSGLPLHGPIVRAIIESLLHLLSEKVHGHPMRNSGCGFVASSEILQNQDILEALKTAIRFSRILVSDPTSTVLTPETEFRLSFSLAPNEWLPMRDGDRLILKSESLFAKTAQPIPPPTAALHGNMAKEFIEGLELKLLESIDNEK